MCDWDDADLDEWDESDEEPQYKQTDIAGRVYDVIPVKNGEVKILCVIPNPRNLTDAELERRCRTGWTNEELGLMEVRK